VLAAIDFDLYEKGESMEFFIIEHLGLALNFIGTIMVAMSFGKNPENAHSTDSKGRPIYLASFLYPRIFRLGLASIAIGFLLQLVA
jgi:hypothetical protein